LRVEKPDYGTEIGEGSCEWEVDWIGGIESGMVGRKLEDVDVDDRSVSSS